MVGRRREAMLWEAQGPVDYYLSPGCDCPPVRLGGRAMWGQQQTHRNSSPGCDDIDAGAASDLG